jgi:phosphoglycolate phosphatase
MKTLVLDFDGTIADTRNSIVRTIQFTAKELGLPEAKESEIIRLIGLPLKNTLIQAMHISNEKLLDEAIALYRAKYNEISIDTVELFPNVKDTLEIIYNQGITITIASNKGRNGLTSSLKKLGIIQYFSVVLGEQDVQNKKPAPDMVLRILEETKSTPKETLVVGDTTYDILMGQQANCITCGVTYGNHTENQLKAQGADYIIDDFKTIIEIIKII